VLVAIRERRQPLPTDLRLRERRVTVRSNSDIR